MAMNKSNPMNPCWTLDVQCAGARPRPPLAHVGRLPTRGRATPPPASPRAAARLHARGRAARLPTPTARLPTLLPAAASPFTAVAPPPAAGRLMEDGIEGRRRKERGGEEEGEEGRKRGKGRRKRIGPEKRKRGDVPILSKYLSGT
uniref:Uncharacterized protein n=1 Tax=Oryza rufipogon TaxID=4529 RepID=A0A0E0MWS3_ORYRU